MWLVDTGVWLMWECVNVRWVGSCYICVLAGPASGAPWAVIMIVFWPVRPSERVQTWHRSQGPGHRRWTKVSLDDHSFSDPVHRHKNKIWRTHTDTQDTHLHSLLHTRPHPSLCQLSSSSLNAESLISISIMTLKSIFEEHKRHILNTKNGFPWRLFQHMQT